MIKEFKYIFRRIIVGVGIALLLMLIKTNVFAKEISSVWMPFNNHIATVSNLDENVTFSTGGGNWSNWGFGYLRFNFSIIKVSGSATAPLVIPNSVAVNNYACDVSSTSSGNSTFTGSTYSATCPMIMSSNGLTGLYIGLTGNQQNEQSTYRITLGGLFTFEKVEDISLDTSSTTNAVNNQTQSIINNQNQNNQAIINNQNSNAQSIINNQNANSQAEIESQKVCNNYHIDNSSIVLANSLLGPTGLVTSNNEMGITDYYPVNSDSELIMLTKPSAGGRRFCFYNNNKTLLSCVASYNYNNNDTIPIVANAGYIRFTIEQANNKPIFTLKTCNNGNQAIVDSQNNINNTLNDDNVSGASSEASSFFDDFQSNSHGLSGVITAPLRLVNSLTTATCNPLQFQLPFIHNQVSLPCMKSIYENHFGIFFSLYQLITTGLICYLVMINLYSKIHNLQNPNNDRIEVLNL